MDYHKHLREDQWRRIEYALPGKKNDPGRSGEDNRRFVEGVIWIGRNGGRWLPFSVSMANGQAFINVLRDGQIKVSGK
jgi:transposase